MVKIARWAWVIACLDLMAFILNYISFQIFLAIGLACVIIDLIWDDTPPWYLKEDFKNRGPKNK